MLNVSDCVACCMRDCVTWRRKILCSQGKTSIFTIDFSLFIVCIISLPQSREIMFPNCHAEHVNECSMRLLISVERKTEKSLTRGWWKIFQNVNYNGLAVLITTTPRWHSITARAATEVYRNHCVSGGGIVTPPAKQNRRTFAIGNGINYGAWHNIRCVEGSLLYFEAHRTEKRGFGARKSESERKGWGNASRLISEIVRFNPLTPYGRNFVGK